MIQYRYANEVMWQLKVNKINQYGLIFIESYHCFDTGDVENKLQNAVMSENWRGYHYKVAVCTENTIFFTILGIIRPYKNIEIVINFFTDLKLPGTKLIMAGQPVNKEYGKK